MLLLQYIRQLLVISLIFVIAYKLLLPKFPFNLFTAFLAQLPIIIFSLVGSGDVLDFSSTYEAATSTVELIPFISIAFVFIVLMMYNKNANKGIDALR